jgi:aminoglycoside phosphotransferase (APT) family kinase protein
MHTDEVEIDATLVKRLVSTQFPQWATRPIALANQQGTVNLIYRLGVDLAVRLPRTPRDHDIHAEVDKLRMFGRRLPLAIPEPVAIGEPAEGYPWNWGVFRWIEGEPWRPERLADPCSAAVALADFLRALHGIDSKSLPAEATVGVRPLAANDGMVRAYAMKAGELIDADRFLREWEKAVLLPGWLGEPVVVHSDLMAGNLLVRGGQLAAVIDWASAHAGDPARDLQAAWRLFTGEARTAFREALPYDEGTWERARGYVLRSVVGVTYYATSNPAFAAENLAALRETLADL